MVSHGGRKIIATCSARRAAKDKSDREERLETAQKLLCSFIQLSGSKRRYIVDPNALSRLGSGPGRD